MQIDDLIQHLQQVKFVYGNLTVMANHESISSVDHIEGMEDMPGYINMEIL